jgi:hypothetical protein
MRRMVEGHPQVNPSLEGMDYRPVPLHHPAGGPPPRSGED